MNSKPLVSILISSYNHEQFIGEAIDSCLNQTYSPIEVIVVDDGSTDNSQEVIENYGDKLIPIFKDNGGVASTRNVGFPICKGEYICLLDSDDYFMTDKVERMVKVVTSDYKIGWYFHRVKVIDTERNELIRITPGKLTGYCDIRNDIKRGRMPIHGPSMSGLSFSRAIFEQILPLPEEPKYRLTDKYIRVVAASLSPGFFEDAPLGVLRLHGANKFSTFSLEDKLPKLARVLIRNAFGLRKNWPDTIRYSNRLLGQGIGIFNRIGGINDEYEGLIKECFAFASSKDRLEILLYLVYYQYIWDANKSVKI